MVVRLPGVPSFEGPEGICSSGLDGCSYLNCEQHEADTGCSLQDCFSLCKCPVHKSTFWWCYPQCQLFIPSGFHGFNVVRRVSVYAGFPITLVLIFFEKPKLNRVWIFLSMDGIRTVGWRFFESSEWDGAAFAIELIYGSFGTACLLKRCGSLGGQK